MRIRVTNGEAWIPDWKRQGFDNLALPVEDQVVIHIDYPTTRSHGRMQSYVPKVQTETGRATTEVEVVMDHNRILRECVNRIDNLEIEDEDGTVVPIRTADQLLDARQLDDLRDLVSARIIGYKVEEEQLGKS